METHDGRVADGIASECQFAFGLVADVQYAVNSLDAHRLLHQHTWTSVSLTRALRRTTMMHITMNGLAFGIIEMRSASYTDVQAPGNLP